MLHEIHEMEAQSAYEDDQLYTSASYLNHQIKVNLMVRRAPPRKLKYMS
jgi:hypothetical protein